MPSQDISVMRLGGNCLGGRSFALPFHFARASLASLRWTDECARPYVILFGAEEEDGDGDTVADFGGGGAEEEVGEEAVSVGAHGDEVAVLLLDPTQAGRN